eukprot:6410706-Prorocentrum_lima.AAC.1
MPKRLQREPRMWDPAAIAGPCIGWSCYRCMTLCVEVLGRMQSSRYLQLVRRRRSSTVSYTHLTLPTICSV